MDQMRCCELDVTAANVLVAVDLQTSEFHCSHIWCGGQFGDEGFQEISAARVGSSQLDFQLVDQGHQLIYFGYDTVLFGGGRDGRRQSLNTADTKMLNGGADQRNGGASHLGRGGPGCRNKIGLDVALEALRHFRRHHRAGLDDLWRFARVCRVTTVIRPYLEALG